MKYVNKPVMNAVQKIRLKMTTTKKHSIVEKADLILNKKMKHKEITREKYYLKIGCPQYEREF